MIEPIKFKGAVIILVKPKVSVVKPLKNSEASEVAPELSELFKLSFKLPNSLLVSSSFLFVSLF